MLQVLRDHLNLEDAFMRFIQTFSVCGPLAMSYPQSVLVSSQNLSHAILVCGQFGDQLSANSTTRNRNMPSVFVQNFPSH
jgi:hypothetical protein